MMTVAMLASTSRADPSDPAYKALVRRTGRLEDKVTKCELILANKEHAKTSYFTEQYALLKSRHDAYGGRGGCKANTILSKKNTRDCLVYKNSVGYCPGSTALENYEISNSAPVSVPTFDDLERRYEDLEGQLQECKGKFGKGEWRNVTRTADFRNFERYTRYDKAMAKPCEDGMKNTLEKVVNDCSDTVEYDGEPGNYVFSCKGTEPEEPTTPTNTTSTTPPTPVDPEAPVDAGHERREYEKAKGDNFSKRTDLQHCQNQVDILAKGSSAVLAEYGDFIAEHGSYSSQKTRATLCRNRNKDNRKNSTLKRKCVVFPTGDVGQCKATYEALEPQQWRDLADAERAEAGQAEAQYDACKLELTAAQKSTTLPIAFLIFAKNYADAKRYKFIFLDPCLQDAQATIDNLDGCEEVNTAELTSDNASRPVRLDLQCN